MDTQALDFLKQLVAIPTPSGFEQDGMRLIAAYLEKNGVPGAAFDLHGNLRASLNAGAKTRVMIDGHCDEIGFMVQYIDDDGFLYMCADGGVTPQTLAGERIVIQGLKGPVNGVFGVRPPHLMKASDKDKVAPQEVGDIAVDIGAATRDEALSLVELGAPAVVDAGWRPLANDRVACRGFDDRIGAFIVAEAMRRLVGKKLNVAVHMVASIQEELGLIGCETAAYDIQPDIGICVDVGFASDSTPADRKTVGDVRLGKGPIHVCGPLYNPKLQKIVADCAAAEKIPLQRQVRSRGQGTHAFPMRMVRSGAAVSLLSIPLRYMHSPIETLSLGDVEQVIQLLVATLQALPESPDLTPSMRENGRG